IVYWTVNGIRFIDEWSVRRRPAMPMPIDALWMGLFSERRVREAEAAAFQFQDQVRQLVASGTNLSSVTASAYFRYLPPAGMLPAAWIDSPVGLDPQQFFGASGSTEVALLDGGRFRSLLHEALYHEPIDLVTAKQRIQRYWLWENALALAAGATT